MQINYFMIGYCFQNKDSAHNDRRVSELHADVLECFLMNKTNLIKLNI